MNPRSRIPSYRKHKPSGRAVVTVNGADRYIGKYGTAESKAAYARLIAELATGVAPKPQGGELTVTELLAAYWKYARCKYGGRPSARSRLPDADDSAKAVSAKAASKNSSVFERLSLVNDGVLKDSVKSDCLRLGGREPKAAKAASKRDTGQLTALAGGGLLDSPDGWSAAAWADELDRKAERCEDLDPMLAADYRRQAAAARNGQAVTTGEG